MRGGEFNREREESNIMWGKGSGEAFTGARTRSLQLTERKDHYSKMGHEGKTGSKFRGGGGVGGGVFIIKKVPRMAR